MKVKIFQDKCIMYISKYTSLRNVTHYTSMLHDCFGFIRSDYISFPYLEGFFFPQCFEVWFICSCFLSCRCYKPLYLFHKFWEIIFPFWLLFFQMRYKLSPFPIVTYAASPQKKNGTIFKNIGVSTPRDVQTRRGSRRRRTWSATKISNWPLRPWRQHVSPSTSARRDRRVEMNGRGPNGRKPGGWCLCWCHWWWVLPVNCQPVAINL